MQKAHIERFISCVNLQMPELLKKEYYTGADLYDDMAVLEYRLPTSYHIDELLDKLDDCMELVILYHVIPTEAVVYGNQCCAYSDPTFDYIFKVNGISNDDAVCDTLYVSLYDSLETLGLDVLSELRDQTAKSKVVFARAEEDVLRDFMR